MAKLPVPKKPANILCICFSAFVIIIMNGITKKLLKDMKKNTDRLKKGKKLMKSVEKYGTGTGKGIPTVSLVLVQTYFCIVKGVYRCCYCFSAWE